MRQKLPKLFSFEQKNRARLTFSDAAKIRLNPLTGRVELRAQGYNLALGTPIYPLDTDLTVTTWLTTPAALVAWDGFSAAPHGNAYAAGASVRFKLNDGTDDRYWDGGAWAVAGATDWNTEVEVAANVATFPATSKAVAVVCNLVTTDASVTPWLDGVCLLMDCEIDYIRSLLADSLLVSLGATIRPTLDAAMLAPGGLRVDLRDLETAYVISDVSEVYDHTADPNHATNLLSSYDSSNRVLMLTTDVERGSSLWVRFPVEPELYFNWASQDYTEVEKIPAIFLENFELMGNTITAVSQVDNIAAFTASVRRDPFRLNIDFDVVLLAEKNRTLLAMLDKALQYAASTHVLVWEALDEQVDMTISTEGLFRPKPSLKDEHAVRFSMSLLNVYLWLEPEASVPLIQQLALTFTGVNQQGGPLWAGVKTGQPHPNDH